ncbi:unnamed protein product, partial [Ectocarpus sp. 12 AP-2014]
SLSVAATVGRIVSPGATCGEKVGLTRADCGCCGGMLRRAWLLAPESPPPAVTFAVPRGLDFSLRGGALLHAISRRRRGHRVTPHSAVEDCRRGRQLVLVSHGRVLRPLLSHRPGTRQTCERRRPPGTPGGGDGGDG